MAEQFDYFSFWDDARDVLEATTALDKAIRGLPVSPVPPWGLRNPSRDSHRRYEAQIADYPARRAKALSAIHKAVVAIEKLLSEDRFVAPVAGVWPPCAPDIARKLSSGLGLAAGAARTLIGRKDGAPIDGAKRTAYFAVQQLRSVVEQLERRPDVADLAYRRQVEKLRRQNPGWAGPAPGDRTGNVAGEGGGRTAGEAQCNSSVWRQDCLNELVTYQARIQDATATVADLELDASHPLVLAMKHVQLPPDLGKAWLSLQEQANSIRTCRTEGGKRNRKHDILDEIGQLSAFLRSPPSSTTGARDGNGGQGEADDGTADAVLGVAATAKKRSTVKGEARAKIIGALTKHHQYADGGCLNVEPIGNNEFARKAGVSESTASAFFKKEFKEYAKYRAACGDSQRLLAALKLLNQEFSPHHLFGRSADGERDDEE